eukprot:TRINITY_DN43920_c0_g1_i1.p1 TRINITY_DN43920_c0_g1~~TRINITY_DN43920_c0_g1_i1.p1  ORF type:complete len:195 (-),score=74.08 TRINITY_DN43920_c0_g1_i1:190-774(-)
MVFRSICILTLMFFAAIAAEEIAEDEMAQLFSEMDTDKDGSLSLDEFSGFSDGDDHGMSAEELAEMKQETKFEFDKLDEDNNGLLSLAEMARQTEEGSEPEEQGISSARQGSEEDMNAETLMEELDKDKDGLLSFEEFEGELPDMDGVEEADSEHMKEEMLEEFRKGDKNNDGKLSVEELRALDAGDVQLNAET